jgi:hypothetical protein
MRVVRNWSVRHAQGLKRFYDVFEGAIAAAEPVARAIGYERLERPVAVIERGIKGAMFDCQMCGQCALSSTGMSCPMNCPKNLRNGPCGGVRADLMCEVKPDMPCVWVKAWEGGRDLKGEASILDVQKPVDHRLKDKSSWLKVMRDIRARRDGAPAPAKASARNLAGSGS